MKRYTPLRRLVSPSPSPNRTCGFPRIRLSMHGRLRARGWPSDSPEASKRIPEVEQAFALLLPPGRVPSVRFLDSQVRVTHGSSVAEEPQAFGPFGPLPPFPGDAEMIA